MHTQIKIPDIFSKPTRLRNLLAKFGCAVVIGSQHLLVEGLFGIPATANAFAVLILCDMLVIVALTKLISTNVARDFLDIVGYDLIYQIMMVAMYTMQLKFFNTLLAYSDAIARFFFIIFCLRLFWPIKVAGTDNYYAWPIIGPVSWLFSDKSEEKVVRKIGHSLFVYLVLAIALTYSLTSGKLPYEEHWKQTIGGMLGFVIFFKFFSFYMQSSIKLVNENIQHRNQAERLETLIESVQKQAEGQLNPELVEVMCMFSEMNDETQKVMAGAIRDLHKKIVAGKVTAKEDD